MEELSLSENVVAIGGYEGIYHDVMGHHGEIKLSLQRVEHGLEGSCDLILNDEDEPVAFRGKMERFSEVKNSRDDPSKAVIQLELVLPEGEEGTAYEQQSSQWTAEVTIYFRPATPYAKQAMYGTLSSTGDSGLSGGVWIAWKYAT